MKKYRCLIIDDERLAREELKSNLKDFYELEICGEAENGTVALEKITSLRPDLLFLDVNMPGMTGFELLKKLDEIPHVIFLTAYDEFAIKAFEVNALDYLLKPLDHDRLIAAIERLKQLDANEFESNTPDLSSLRPALLGPEDHVFIKDGERTFFIRLSEVRFLESEGNYVKVHFEKNRPLVLRSLNSFEERLNPVHFFRINRKHIVNIDWISRIENWFSGGLQIELKTGEKLEVSRRQALRFRDLFSF